MLEPDRADEVLADQRLGELLGAVARDADRARAVAQELADRVGVALGDEPPVHEHDDARRHPLDLVEHVRRDQHGAALLAELARQLDDPAALGRVGAVERLVEQQQLGIVDERAGELDPLAHALREAADGAIGGVGELDGPEHALGRGARVGDVAQLARTCGSPRAPTGTATARRRPGTTPTLRNTSGSRRGSCPSTRTVPMLGVAKPAHSLSAVDLPAPLWPSRPVTPGESENAEARDRDRVAVPLRDVVERERRRHVSALR